MEHATSTRDAVDIIANAPRGMSWLYPVCDANADCVIIEAGKHLPEGEYFNPLQYVNNSDVLALLPDQAFLDAHSSNDIFNQGIYVRSMNWTYPEEYLVFNEALYELAGMPYTRPSGVPLASSSNRLRMRMMTPNAVCIITSSLLSAKPFLILLSFLTMQLSQSTAFR